MLIVRRVQRRQRLTTLSMLGIRARYIASNLEALCSAHSRNGTLPAVLVVFAQTSTNILCVLARVAEALKPLIVSKDVLLTYGMLNGLFVRDACFRVKSQTALDKVSRFRADRVPVLFVKFNFAPCKLLLEQDGVR